MPTREVRRRAGGDPARPARTDERRLRGLGGVRRPHAGWASATFARRGSRRSIGAASTSSSPVGDGDGEQSCRIDFDAPIDSPFELQAAMFGLIARARAISGEEGMTSAEREVAEMVGDPHVRRRGRRRSPTCIRTCVVSSCGGDDLAGVRPERPGHVRVRAVAAAGSRRADDRPDVHVGGLRADARGGSSGRCLLHGASVGSRTS